MSLTGLPAEYINILIENLTRRDLDEIDQVLNFANDLVEQALSECSDRNWCIELRKLSPTKSFELHEGFSAIRKWLAGIPWNELATEFALSFDNDLIYTGSFLNNSLLQLSQFWGCLAICEKILFGPESHHFDFLQPFVRNGVNTKQKLLVLKEIGNNDRVLAHNITSFFDLNEEENITNMQTNIQQQLRRWKLNQEIIPPELGLDEVMALRSILDDLYIP